jgi:uncharacterized protein
MFFNSDKNSTAHWVVVKNKPELLSNISEYKSLNSWGFAPHDIAKHLNRKSCLRMLNCSVMGWRNFRATFNHLNFFPGVVFENYRFLKKIVNKCQKYIKKDYFHPSRLWLGTVYENEILNNLLPKLSIAKVNDKIGYGVFANENIAVGTYLGEYGGILKKRHKKLFKNNFYCMRYSFYEEDFSYIIDAGGGGNHTRFINHNNNPNVEIRSAVVKNLLRIIFIAAKPIKKNEQLLCHYGDEYWKDLRVKHGF